MSMDAKPGSAEWAAVITDAYARGAKPPLTRELVEQVRARLTQALESSSAESSDIDLERLNATLDAFEAELRSVVGPRVESLDDATGSVVMKHRSEAGQPLRAFGGQ